MPELVGTELKGKTYSNIMHKEFHSIPGQLAAILCTENIGFVFIWADIPIFLDVLQGDIANRDKTLFVAFSMYFHDPPLQVNITPQQETGFILA